MTQRLTNLSYSYRPTEKPLFATLLGLSSMILESTMFKFQVLKYYRSIQCLIFNVQISVSSKDYRYIQENIQYFVRSIASCRTWTYHLLICRCQYYGSSTLSYFHMYRVHIARNLHVINSLPGIQKYISFAKKN